MKIARTCVLAAALAAVSWAGGAAAYTHGWNTAECWPAFRNNWQVEANCTMPAGDTGYGVFMCGRQVYGNIYVGNATVAMPANCNLGINLTTNKATFAAGKITFGASSKMTNLGGARYFRCYAYSQANVTTNCPDPMDVIGGSSRGRVMNTANTDILSGVVTGVSADGVICCGREGY